jgi:hypothetical protein
MPTHHHDDQAPGTEGPVVEWITGESRDVQGCAQQRATELGHHLGPAQYIGWESLYRWTGYQCQSCGLWACHGRRTREKGGSALAVWGPALEQPGRADEREVDGGQGSVLA